jgi:signal transduction histidine kinase
VSVLKKRYIIDTFTKDRHFTPSSSGPRSRRHGRSGAFLYASAVCLLLACGLAALSRLVLCSAEAIECAKTERGIEVTRIPQAGGAAAAGLAEGDRILSIDGIVPSESEDVHFLLQGRRAGTRIDVAAERKGIRFSAEFRLSRRYGILMILSNLVLGLSFWIVGVFVYWKKSEERAARLFGWGMPIIGFTILAVCEPFPFGGTWIEFVPTALYGLLYPLVPPFILAFALLYPKPKRLVETHPSVVQLAFLPGVALSILMTASFWTAAAAGSLPAARLYARLYGPFRIFMAACIVGAVACLIHSRMRGSPAGRRRVQWILWAVAVGAAPFVFLWTIPLALGFQPAVPEVVTSLFMLVIPVAFAFSIVKYRAWDIEFIASRSIAYTASTAIIVLAYAGVAGMAGYGLGTLSPGAGRGLTVLCTLGAVFLFSPLRRSLQNFVDRHFYKARYNFRLAIRRLSGSLAEAADREAVAGLLLESVHSLIPTDKSVWFVKDERRDAFVVAGGSGISREEKDLWERECPAGFFNRSADWAGAWVRRKPADAEGVEEMPADLPCGSRGIEALIPVRIEGRTAALLALGVKRSTDPYYGEDIELLLPMAEQAALTWKRIELREEVIRAGAEREKLEALDRLKSEFVSHVSHELRTPLSAMLWSVENLLDGIPEALSKPVRQTLEGVDECGGQLGRMISNLLDLTKIEAGRIDLRPETIPAADAVRRAAALLEPAAGRKRIRIEAAADPSLAATADRDALDAVLTNLLDNAVKYSPEGSVVRIGARRTEDGRIRFFVTDSGIGIPSDKLDSIFERFERVRTDRAGRQKGLGLGLHIAQKLMKLQGGLIGVKSAPGEGSTFTADLPAAA